MLNKTANIRKQKIVSLHNAFIGSEVEEMRRKLYSGARQPLDFETILLNKTYFIASLIRTRINRDKLLVVTGRTRDRDVRCVS